MVIQMGPAEDGHSPHEGDEWQEGQPHGHNRNMETMRKTKSRYELVLDGKEEDVHTADK